MSFSIHYAKPKLFRDQAHIEWIMPALKSRAHQLGWDGKEPLTFYDSDGLDLGGFVPCIRN